MTTALVLSGGGARGDFEVGAVRYLYDHGVQPQIICGTSVGAINGVKLAEGGNEALGGLENIWLQLQSVDQMFGLAGMGYSPSTRSNIFCPKLGSGVATIPPARSWITPS